MQDKKVAHVERIMAIFERQNDDGTYYYPDTEVRHFLPLLVFALAPQIELSAWPASVLSMLGDFADATGLPEMPTPEQVQEAIDTMYTEYPVEPELLKEFQRVVFEAVADLSDFGRNEAADKLLGRSPTPIPSPSSARPYGATSLLQVMLQQPSSASGSEKTSTSEDPATPEKK